jgi:hypothetical protein
MEETVGIRQVMWLVMLESAKDRILGVDVTPTFYKNKFFCPHRSAYKMHINL